MLGPRPATLMDRLDSIAEVDRPRVLRLWNYWNKGESFWPIREWPLWAQIAATKAHLSYVERYELFFFFAVNGLPPDLCEEWVLATDAVRDRTGLRLVSLGYDESARSHVRSMIPQYANGTMVKQRGARMYDMVLGRPILHQ